MRRPNLLLPTLALAFVFAWLLGGCPDTRGTCPIQCDNYLRCGFATDRGPCESMCTTNLARASADCRTQTDRYQRCWLAQSSCPLSLASAAPGCGTEFNDAALACTFASPLLGEGDGI